MTPPLQHDRAVHSVAFSPDGKRVLTRSAGAPGRVWNAATGEPIAPVLKPEDEKQPARRYSPDGKRVVTASEDGPSRIFEAMTGELVATMEKGRRGVLSASFSPDALRFLTAEEDGTVTIWDATKGGPVFEPIQAGIPLSLAIFSPDGERILTATGDPRRPSEPGIARVWSARTGAPLTPPLSHNLAVVQGSFSPDSSRIVTATIEYRDAGGVARIWDAGTGGRIGSDLPQGSFPRGAVFSPDGSRVATCSENGTARVWDVETGKPMTPPLKHGSWALHVTFSPDGDSLATASEDHLVRIWDLVTDDTPELNLQDQKHDFYEMAAFDAAFSSDGTKVLILSPGSDNTRTRIRDATTGEQLGAAMQENGSAGLAAFSPDGTKLVTAAGNVFGMDESSAKASVWNVATGDQLFAVSHKAPVRYASFGSDGKFILTTSEDGTARVWDSRTGEPAGPFLQHEGGVWHGSFSPDGQHVVTASYDRSAQVWEWGTGRKVFPAFRHKGSVDFAAYNREGGRIVTTSQDQTLRIWNAVTGEPVTQPLWQGGNVIGASFSPNGYAVASWSLAPRVRVWNTESGERLLPPLEHKAGVNWAEFSPDGRFIATASADQSARLWDAGTGEAVSSPLPHGGEVHKTAFHPKGGHILTASDTGARIWKLNRLSWPVEDMTLLARLLAAYEIDQTLSRAALSRERIVAAFHTLKSKYPEHFSRTPEQRLAWHRTQALEAEIAGSWATADWHLSWLIAKTPEAELYARRADARAERRQWQLARQDCAKANELDPECHQNIGTLLLLCLKAEDKEAARALARRLVQRAGSTTGEERCSAASLVSCVPDLLEDYSQIVEWAKDQPASAVVLYRMGRYQEAVENFRALRSSDPSFTPSSRYYHAMALHHLGEGEKARETLAAGQIQFDRYLRQRIEEKLPWYHLVVCELARDEAEALMAKAPPRVESTKSE